LRERLGTDNIITVVQQNRLRWYGRVGRKVKNDWVKMTGLQSEGYKTSR